MAGKKRATSDAAEILRRRYVDDAAQRAQLEEVRAEAEVARSIHRLRTEAGLTQQALAELVGTTPSAISRLEDADYRGHSLSMLRRIAAALGRRVEIQFPVAAPAEEDRPRPATKAAQNRARMAPESKSSGVEKKPAR